MGLVNDRNYPGDETSIKESGMAAERPLETYSPDELLDMFKDAGNNVANAIRRRIEIQDALQSKLDRLAKEFNMTEVQHNSRINGEPYESDDVPARSEYRNGGQY